MNTPKNLQYTRSHEWVEMLDGGARIGLTDHAQDALGSIVFVNLPAVGDSVTAAEALGDVESVKAVSDVLSPITGTVSAVNEELLDAPEKINDDPYGAWLIETSDVTGTDELLSAEAYEAFCAEEG